MEKIMTSRGEMDEDQLERREYPQPNGTSAVEYYLDGELVHRSVVLQLTGVAAKADAHKF